MTVAVYLEVGAKRVFAGALEWPGWCRSARDEAGALDALTAYAPRYRAALGSRSRGMGMRSARDLDIVERLRGDATTDFGAPGKAPTRDAEPVASTELNRLIRILEACWDAFDEAAARAKGKTLRKGPRGGGRSLAKIRAHVLDAEKAYLSTLGGSASGEVRAAFIDALRGRARGEIPDRGPRGGARWSPRYAIRRTAWHALDHAWEIEDRAGGT